MLILEAGSSSVDPLAFVQYGILGLVLLMLLTGWLWAKPAVDQMKETHEKERQLWEDRILPNIDRLNRNIEQNNQLLSESLRRRDGN